MILKNRILISAPNVYLAPRGNLWTGDRNPPLPFGGGAVSATESSIYRRLDNLFEKTAQHTELLHAKACHLSGETQGLPRLQALENEENSIQILIVISWVIPFQKKDCLS